MSVSVVIPTRNRGGTLLRAVASAAVENPCEVVVVDDASTDDTPAILAKACEHYPCVRVVRHATKSVDWQAAAATVYAALAGTHVICMGADDALVRGIVASVGRFPSAAVVFHDYWVASTDDQITGGVCMGYDVVTELTPTQMQQRLVSHPYASETGIGSAIRKDHLLWLTGQQFWRMGPYSDAIGYSVVAAVHGCVFAPGAAAVFTVDDDGYGERHRTGGRANEYHQAARDFVDRVALTKDVRAAICRKRGISYG